MLVFLVVRAVSVLFLLSIAVCTVVAQISAVDDAPASRYLLRVDRATRGLDVCVLVRDDGAYHYEADDGEEAKIFEGDLSPSEFSQVRQWVADDALAIGVPKDTQENVSSLFSPPTDELSLSIFRGDRWEILFFPSASSRKPYEQSLAPMVAWLASMPTGPHRAYAEDTAKHNCMPPRKIEFSIRPQVPATASKGLAQTAQGEVKAPDSQSPGSPSPASARSLLVMRLVTDRGFEAEVARTCTIVYSSGRYHAEKSRQKYTSKPTFTVFEGELATADLDALRQMLSDPALKSATSGDLHPRILGRRWESNLLWISRSEGIQQLTFVETFDLAAWTFQAPMVSSKNIKLIKPLREWVKAKTDTEKRNVMTGGVASNCDYHP